MPPPALEHDARDGAADALLAVAPLVSRWSERLLAAHEPPLTPTQYLALRAVANEALTGADLARRTGVSGAAVSQLLGALQRGGLLERHPLEADRRHHALALSAAGREVLESAGALLRERLGALLGELPHPEADALARSLTRVQADLTGTAPPRRPPRPRPPHHAALRSGPPPSPTRGGSPDRGEPPRRGPR